MQAGMGGLVSWGVLTSTPTSKVLDISHHKTYNQEDTVRLDRLCRKLLEISAILVLSVKARNW